MLLELIALLAVVCGTAPGLAWALVRRWSLDPAEQLVASTALSLLGAYLIAWTIYVAALPVTLLWCLPTLGVVGLLSDWRAFVALLRAPDARALVLGQALVTAWCLGWLALVATYSGGGWTADWFEHWERARFFIARGAPDTIFIGHATVTARPPLANVLVGAFAALVRLDFAAYQVVSTLLASLAFLPAALFARRWGGSRAIAIAVVVAMLNPLFLQNATFAWTKLPAAFFALCGLHFFLRALRAATPSADAMLSATFLAAGLLAHYSVGPYVVLLTGGWLVQSWRRRADPLWWRATLAAGLVGAAVLATWFAWSLRHYGSGGTLLANTTVLAADSSFTGQLSRIALNLRDTIVPHHLRDLDRALIAQKGTWGALRDSCFQLYQVNLLFAFGSAAWLVLGAQLARAWRSTPSLPRRAWAAFIAGAVFLGVAVHGARDTWGLTHICLQPLVLLGLAFLAAAWPQLSRGWRTLLIAGAAVDFVFGIALHFAVQHLAFERWGGPAAFAAWQSNASESAVMNMAAKLQHQLRFFGDALAAPSSVIVAFLLALLSCALWRARPARDPSCLAEPAPAATIR